MSFFESIITSIPFGFKCLQSKKKRASTSFWKKHAAEIFQNFLSRYNRSQIKTHQVLSSVISMCLHIVTARKRLPGLAVTLSKCALTSSALAKKGFAEAFRTIYPDEMENFGQTRWKTPATHGRLSLESMILRPAAIAFFVFQGRRYGGPNVKNFGESKNLTDVVVCPYPSDYRAVIASFVLSKLPKLKKSDMNKLNTRGV